MVPILILYSDKNKGAHNTIMHSKQSHNSGRCQLLMSANLIIFTVIIMIFIIALIENFTNRTGCWSQAVRISEVPL